MKGIPYSRQFIDKEDIKAVLDVLRSDFLTQGPKTGEFEAALSEYCGARYAVVFSSGTAALHAAYFAAGISPGDEIITSPVTFAATANAGLYVGARPVFTDIAACTGNIDTTKIETKITKNTKLLVPVHYAGYPVDMESVHRIAKNKNLIVIEDACHALGARYKKQRNRSKELQNGKWEKIGSCRHSDMTVLSFHPVKHITTGEGGAVLTNKSGYYRKLCMFRTHGITKDHSRFTMHAPRSRGNWYYEMQFLGYNYRLTDFQAALGISQLKKLDSFVQRRRAIAEMYNQAFKNNPYFDIQPEEAYVCSSYHLYPILLNGRYRDKKRVLFSALQGKGIGLQVHYIPVYLHPYYQRLGYKKGLCPVAEDFHQRELSIPVYPCMKDKDIRYVINTLLQTLQEV
jgi:UDP-4-amino-4,6-dideoxy-N-acetyl-beta-L-altrosamine transaminase